MLPRHVEIRTLSLGSYLLPKESILPSTGGFCEKIALVTYQSVDSLSHGV